jgi:hypothetical protein
MTKSDLIKFFAERPSVSVAGIAKESGYSGRYLQMILDGDRPLSDSAIEKIKPIIEKYGG